MIIRNKFKILFSIFLFLGVANFAFSQRIITNNISYDEVLKYEQKLNSKNITIEVENNEDFIIYNKNDVYYPFSASLIPPIEFLRTVSDFHIDPKIKYYFDRQGKKLLFVEMHWSPQNNLDIFNRSFLTELDRVLNEESLKKGKYKSFYNKLNKKLTSIYGKPTKRIKVKKWEAYNSDGWRYEWSTDMLKITTELRMPKEGFVDLIFINYTIGFK